MGTPQRIQATFRFFLGPEGRRRSRAQGGDGRRTQQFSLEVRPEDMAVLDVDPSGKVSADLRTIPGPTGERIEIEFDRVPTGPECVAYLRQRAERDSHARAARAQAAARVAVRVRDAFLRTPGARATAFGPEGTVQIDAHGLPLEHAALFESPDAPPHLVIFPPEDPISFEARRRSLADAVQRARQAAAEGAGRAALIIWIQRYGPESARKHVQDGNWSTCRMEFGRAYRPEGYLLWPDLVAEISKDPKHVSIEMLPPMPDELRALERVGSMPELCSAPALVWVKRTLLENGQGVAETWCTIRLELHTPDNASVYVYRRVSVRSIAPIPSTAA